jgi:hypothetical protein
MKILLMSLMLLPVVLEAQNENYIVDALVSSKRPEKVIKVGGAGSDINGFTNQSIQTAIDALPAVGGTVVLSPGTFIIKAPVNLKSNTKLIGSGPETILKRTDGYHTKFIDDADFGELKLTVESASGFEKGMSVQITNDTYNDCWDVSTAVITDIVDNVIYIDSHLIRDYDCTKNGIVSNAGSCILVKGAENVIISKLAIDGNKTKNDKLDGCNGGGIAIFKSKHVTVENVTVSDFNGEGITWQITEEVSVRNSEIKGCSGMGLHPGTGSPKTLIEGNNSHNNNVGLFICWRVHHSVVRNNQFHNNNDCGISTGHKDSDVTFSDNHIYENGNNGVYFRNENFKNSPHRNIFVHNTIENNGTRNGGYGFYFSGNAADVLIQDNIIRDNKTGSQKGAIFISKGTPPPRDDNNKMSGHKLGNIVNEK